MHISLHILHGIFKFRKISSILTKRTDSKPGIIMEIMMHSGETGIIQEISEAGGWTVNDGGYCHGIRILPLVSR